MLLAIDTSTSAVTAALHDGHEVVASASTIDARRHTEILGPQIDSMLKSAGVRPGELSRVVVGVGPGPFTGLRVGIVTAMTFAHALDLPLGGVCSLDALAHRAKSLGMTGQLLVATDARRKEVYWATYNLDAERIAPGTPAVNKAVDLPPQVRVLPAVGRGAQLYSDVLVDATNGEASTATMGGDDARPELLDVSAADIASLGFERVMAGERLLTTEPLYLRHADAVPAAAKPNSRVLNS